MNLLTAGTELRKNIERVNSIESNDEILRAWSPLETSLEGWLDDLEKLHKLQNWFVDSGHPILSEIPMPAKLDIVSEGVGKFIEKFSEDYKHAMQGSLWAKTSGGVSVIASQLRETLTDKWSEYVDNCLPDIEHLRPFLEAGTTNLEIEDINSEVERLRAYEGSLPESDEIIKNVEKQGAQLKKQFQELDLGDIPLEVAKFIQKVNSYDGATLNDISKEVLDWLGERKMLKKFLIKTSRL